MTQLAGQVAVVTGASRGIGLAIAESLAGQGATVIRLARSLAAGSHGPYRDLPCDLTRREEIVQASTHLLETWGTPSIIVQSAGVFTLAPLEATGPEEFDRLVDVNLRAPFLLARALLPSLRAAGRGLHVTIGSVADHLAYPENSGYAATKFGVRGLHEVLAAEYATSGVRFSLISPGPTDTAAWDRFDPDTRPGFLRRAEMLRAGDVADAVLFAVTRPPHASVAWMQLMPVPAAGTT